ncbi:MAG: glutathione S-transferase family protein [Methyloligellaceae bacterium]
MLTIYGRANSINVRKVLWLCEDLGLAFERHDYGRGYQDTNTPEFLKLNPNALVPTIVDGDTVVWESNTIMRYLAAKHGPAELYPADIVARALVDQWMDWQLATLQPAMAAMFHGQWLKNPDFSEAQIAASKERTAKLFEILNGQLEKTGAYVAGPDCTIADMAVGPAVHRWFTLAPELPRPAAVDAYYDRIAERPGCQKYVRIDIP